MIFEIGDIERELNSWAISLFLSLWKNNIIELFVDLLIIQLGGFFMSSRKRKHAFLLLKVK
ncbi:hypothetical protein ABE61_18740 [Lysinibacillus sphaericus]|nr:hypothetical protein [Lysinibacillus sphaericus]MBG9479312.1 hypothetical protein [Lysinibacillus sphaericus]MBG9593433.1 hypothetical protein [Lysinibacillus sphaericus]